MADRRAALGPVLRLLEGCDLFASISPGALEKLAGAAERIEMSPDQIVIREARKPMRST